jgi:protein-S-isoprenylcysteine O-methyltransferase Ste14
MTFFDYFQFIFLITFFVIFIGRSILLFVSQKINPFVLGVGKKGIRKFLEYFLLPGLTYWAFEIVNVSLHLNIPILPNLLTAPLFDSIYTGIAGCALMVPGLVLFILSLVNFGSSWRVGVDVKTSGKLVTSGVFCVTRNPIFVFLDLYFIGTFLINASLFFLICLVIIIPAMHFQILEEEKFLESKYQDEYREYKKKVRRYI